MIVVSERERVILTVKRDEVLMDEGGVESHNPCQKVVLNGFLWKQSQLTSSFE